jgi:hypothetical protein
MPSIWTEQDEITARGARDALKHLAAKADRARLAQMAKHAHKAADEAAVVARLVEQARDPKRGR